MTRSDFLLTAASTSARVCFYLDGSAQEFRLTVGPGGMVRPEEHEFRRRHQTPTRLLLGRVAMDFVVLDLATGGIDRCADDGTVFSTYPSFRDWFEFELGELRQNLFDAASELGVSLF